MQKTESLTLRPDGLKNETTKVRIIGIILTEFDQVTYFFEAETELLCTPNYALFPFNTHSCQVAVSPSNMVLFVDNI